MDARELKRQAALHAAEYVESGMTIGLGTGSTASEFVRAIAEKLDSGELKDLRFVSSSVKTDKLAAELGITIEDIDDVEEIDLSIDGVDEINENFIAIKGGGGSLLYEKIMAVNSKLNIAIADDSKLVEDLGKFPLAVEVVKRGSDKLLQRFANLGYEPSFRQKDGEIFVSDDNNYIIDLHLKKIENPRELAAELEAYTGVVEHGLFLGLASKIILAGEDGVREIN